MMIILDRVLVCPAAYQHPTTPLGLLWRGQSPAVLLFNTSTRLSSVLVCQAAYQHPTTPLGLFWRGRSPALLNNNGQVSFLYESSQQNQKS